MSTQHATLTGADVHESKGADDAATGTVAVADGAGSTDWKTVGNFVLTGKLTNIADSTAALWLVSPFSGTVKSIYSAIDRAISTANCVLTATLDSVAITGGTLTITQSGSAAGDIDSAACTALNTITAGHAIKISSDGANGSSDSASAMIVVHILGS